MMRLKIPLYVNGQRLSQVMLEAVYADDIGPTEGVEVSITTGEIADIKMVPMKRLVSDEALLTGVEISVHPRTDRRFVTKLRMSLAHELSHWMK
jgi:hypothetical protein